MDWALILVVGLVAAISMFDHLWTSSKMLYHMIIRFLGEHE